jgi:hypothetical protein
MYFARIPLKTSAQIVHGNALTLDWNDVIHPHQLSFIMGNPPFLGKKEQNKKQKDELKNVTEGIKGAGILDFVTGWYFKSVKYIYGTAIQCAFVSTNSITQGEQAPVLWGWVFSKGIAINFAHRTFNWSNEAKGKAAVHCVIISFSHQNKNKNKKLLYEYESVTGESQLTLVKNINCYLVDAPNVLIENRTSPICNVTTIVKGCEATDNGHLILNKEEKIALIKKEPLAKRWLQPFRGGQDLIKGNERWCLWLVDIQPNQLKKLPSIVSRVNAVRKFRESSPKTATVEKAKTPYLFGEIRLSQKGDSIAIPKVSSQRRDYMPISFVGNNIILNNTVQFIPSGTLYEFGIVQSTMHMSWMRAVAGRMKSDYQYSIKIVYNNYPWPLNPSDKQKKNIEDRAQAVLDAREQFPDATLADLYDPLTMPPLLLKAHQALDKAVDAAYSKKKFKTEAERVAFLFDLYQQYTSLLPKETKKGKKKKT